MKQLVFKTKNGVELFLDEETHTYSSDNFPAVFDALEEDFYGPDPLASNMAWMLTVDMYMSTTGLKVPGAS